MQVWQLIVAGIFVHLILFYSIFDIYFTTPLVHGMTPVSRPGRAPADRLVLFVTDGLRADKFFEMDATGANRIPNLRSVIEQKGVWGISHTRVPTESRPGHVALIAGFYEDVSAVAKGWKENPVDFDSVFNESRHTWSWGSPDILPMFAKGATGDHVKISCYSSDLEDFAGSDMTKLDTWVFEQVEEFFESAQTNSSMKRLLQSNKIVFFLHLLGIDTHGHSNKPHSQEYLNNIKLVDRGIRHIESIIENFYNHDGKTSYVVTADHGMTDWGSHGAGHSHETLTPFVAWGAGIRHAVTVDQCGIHTDSFCQDWGLTRVKRIDMEQADVAPLMTSLIGIPFPVNSVGRLPIDALSSSDKEKAELLLANAEQILAQFQVKMEQVKQRTLSFTFRPFRELITAEKLQALKHIHKLIRNGLFSDAISESHALIDKALRGLRYYQTYDRLFLGLSIAFGFTGWMMYVLFLIVKENTTYRGSKHSDSFISRFRPHIYGILAIIIFFLLFIQSLPLMCYLYCLLPVLLWYKSTEGLGPIVSALKNVKEKGWMTELFVSLAFCIISLEIIILSFYYRELLSLGLMAMALWPVCLHWYRGHSVQHMNLTQLGWIASCTLVAIFPLMPVVGRDTHYDWLLASGILALILGVMALTRFPSYTSQATRLLYVFQLFFVLISIVTVLCTSRSIYMKQGLPLMCQVASWTVLGLSVILPALSPTTIKDRLFSLSLSFLAPYLLLSITYEVFFFVSLSSLLYFWLKSEAEEQVGQSHMTFGEIDFQHHQLIKNNLSRPSIPKYLELSDLRRAVFFIFLIITAFFGTGNIASINSFDPASVYCFLTVFNPFLMGSLMMLKNVIPFLLVTCTFRAIQVVTGTPLRLLFLIVLIMSDFMGLHFFFLVKDYGSWLEIGTTISHYVIVMTMIIFLFLLMGISHALTRWSVHAHVSRLKRL